MSTTVYLESTGATPISPSKHSGWTNSASVFARYPLNISGTKANTSMSNQEWTIAAAFQDWCACQFVSTIPLAAQTISGTVDFGIMARTTTSGANFVAYRIWVAKPDGTLRGTLLEVSENVNTIDSSTYTQQWKGAKSLSSVACTAGDYLVVEVGAYSTNATSKTVGVKIGDDTTYSIITSDSGSSTVALGNAVFSGTITFITAPTSLAYSFSSNTMVKDFATLNVPTWSGGEGGTFTISAGALPTGVTINSTTGVISGTPTVSGVYSFTVKLENAIGNDTKDLIYTIIGKGSGWSLRPKL